MRLVPCLMLVLALAFSPTIADGALQDYLSERVSRADCEDPLSLQLLRSCLRMPGPDDERRAFAVTRIREARRLLSARKPERAIGALEDVLDAFPNLPFALQLRAHARRQLGDLIGALADLDRALESNGENEAMLADRCSVRFRLGDVEGARRDCATARGGPFRAYVRGYALLVHAAVALASGAPDDAEGSITRLLSAWPQTTSIRDGPALRLRAWFLTQRGDAAGARQAMDATRGASAGVEADLVELLGIAPPPPPAVPPTRRRPPG